MYALLRPISMVLSLDLRYEVCMSLASQHPNLATTFKPVHAAYLLSRGHRAVPGMDRAQCLNITG
jgi:hypothetical protein